MPAAPEKGKCRSNRENAALAPAADVTTYHGAQRAAGAAEQIHPAKPSSSVLDTVAAASSRYRASASGRRGRTAPPKASSMLNLYPLAVRPDHRRSGHGAALVRHVEQDLHGAQARLMLIETSGVLEFAGRRRPLLTFRLL